MPDPNNPLSYIGQSNDPTLGTRTVNADKSALNLQMGLAELAKKSQYATTLQQLTNQGNAAIARTNRQGRNEAAALSQGLDFNSPDFSVERKAQFDTTQNLNRGRLAELAAGTGQVVVPPAKPTLGNIFAPENALVPGLTPNERTAAAGLPKTKTGAESGTQRQKTIWVANGPNEPGMWHKEVITETEKDTQDTTQQGLPSSTDTSGRQLLDDEAAQQVLQFLAAEFPEAKEIGGDMFEDESNVYVTIDGQEIPLEKF
jgi:hypothetical protein